MGMSGTLNFSRRSKGHFVSKHRLRVPEEVVH